MENILERTGPWKVTRITFCLSHSKQTNTIFALPVEPLGNGTRLSIGVRGNTGSASPSRWEPGWAALFNVTLPKVSKEESGNMVSIEKSLFFLEMRKCHAIMRNLPLLQYPR